MPVPDKVGPSARPVRGLCALRLVREFITKSCTKDTKWIIFCGWDVVRVCSDQHNKCLYLKFLLIWYKTWPLCAYDRLGKEYLEGILLLWRIRPQAFAETRAPQDHFYCIICGPESLRSPGSSECISGLWFRGLIFHLLPRFPFCTNYRHFLDFRRVAQEGQDGVSTNGIGLLIGKVYVSFAFLQKVSANERQCCDYSFPRCLHYGKVTSQKR